MSALATSIGAMLLALVQFNLVLTLAAIAIALPIACLVAIGRLSRSRVVHAGTTAYVNVLRSSPLVMVMFWVYTVGPIITGPPSSAYVAALAALATFEVAYFAEIIRSGLQSVTDGQRNAGLATGLAKPQVLWLIVLPQAIRRMVPSLMTQALIAFQDSTVASVISVPEILQTTSVMNARDQNPIFLYSVLALIFLLLCYAISMTIRWLDRRSRQRLMMWTPAS